jgi:hypothetical protein
MTTEELYARPRAGGRASPPRALVAAVAVVVVLAAAGLALALGGLGSGGDTDGTYGISQDAPTSFGAIAIDGLGRRVGPSGKRAQMQAFVALTNLSGRPIRYSPAQFRLLGGEDRVPVAGLEATFGRGTLLADANFSGQLRFPAPAEGAERFIEFRDPAGDEPIVIDLSRRGERTPDRAFDRFREGGAAR